MVQKIEFLSKNVKPFTNWIKKFSSIDTTLLLEIDEINKKFIAKVYNEERSVIKFSAISFEDAGFEYKESNEPKRVKAGIYNTKKLSNVIDTVANSEFSCIFLYDEIETDGNKDYACINIKLASKTLKMNVDCTSLSIFKYISDDMFINKIMNTSTQVSFNLAKEMIDQIDSLCVLDSEDKYMKFACKDNIIEAQGKTFELFIEELVNSKDCYLDISKEQFEKLDSENYEVILGDDRLIFKSTNTNTITVISMVEKG